MVRILSSDVYVTMTPDYFLNRALLLFHLGWICWIINLFSLAVINLCDWLLHK